MPRPRQFDADEAGDRIADVFTACGYRGTSMAMLTEAAGLGKQSMYNAFGDKRALYLQAVDRAAARLAHVQDRMERASDGRAAVDAFFTALLATCLDPDPAVHTCIVSAGLLEGIEDEDVASKLREKWRATESLLSRAIERGQRDGSIRNDAGRDELARLLMTLMSGLRVAARATGSPRQLKATTRLALQVLAPPAGRD